VKRFRHSNRRSPYLSQALIDRATRWIAQTLKEVGKLVADVDGASLAGASRLQGDRPGQMAREFELTTNKQDAKATDKVGF